MKRPGSCEPGRGLCQVFPKENEIAASRFSSRRRGAASSGLRALTRAGWLALGGYVLLFLILQSHALWQAPTLVSDKFKQVYYPFINLFPKDFIRLYRGSDAGYFIVLA